MKKYVFSTRIWQLMKLILPAIVFFSVGIQAQVINPDLGAFVLNGKVAIQVINQNSVNQYFALGPNGDVGMDFYFGPDDPRNGVYTSVPVLQTNGKVFLQFGDIPYQNGDVLTFLATEVLSVGNIKEYLFIEGNFVLGVGGPVDVCPTSISCIGNAIYLNFNPNEILLAFSSISPLSLVIPNANLSFYRETWQIDLSRNAIRLKAIGPDCNKVLTGTATFTINGLTCIFQNGVLESSNCTPWTDIPNELGACSPYFDNCALDIIKLLSDVQYTLPCRQWIDYNMCSTESLITRPGKVAIGTNHWSASSLTVKNGIITDKVKISNTGWADYVLEEGYPLMSLEEVEAFISANHRLPGMPAGDDLMLEGSFELGETSISRQAKIEELYLYLIQMEEEIQAMEALLFVQNYLKFKSVK